MKKFSDIIANNSTASLFEVVQSVGIPQSRDQIIPGRMYGFSVMSPVNDLNPRTVSEINNGRIYYDLNPVGLVLFHQRFKEFSLILNLKVIPPAISSKLLEWYYSFSIQNGLDKYYKDGSLIPLDQRRLLDQRFQLITPSDLSTLTGVDNLNYAINKYNMDYVAEARLIDWDNFGQLIRPKPTTHGIFPDPVNLGKIYEDFITNSII